MESNIFQAIQDPPTLTELAVLTLYGQAIVRVLPLPNKSR